jgi:hypothetical protein
MAQACEAVVEQIVEGVDDDDEVNEEEDAAAAAVVVTILLLCKKHVCLFRTDPSIGVEIMAFAVLLVVVVFTGQSIPNGNPNTQHPTSTEHFISIAVGGADRRPRGRRIVFKYLLCVCLGFRFCHPFLPLRGNGTLCYVASLSIRTRSR